MKQELFRLIRRNSKTESFPAPLAFFTKCYYLWVANSKRENAIVNNDLVDWKFTVDNSDSSAVANRNSVHIQTLDRNLTNT